MVRTLTHQLTTQGEEGELYISSDPADQSIIKGFRLNFMNMRDAATGKVSLPFIYTVCILPEGIYDVACHAMSQRCTPSRLSSLG
jgi:hypothetical protein